MGEAKRRKLAGTYPEQTKPDDLVGELRRSYANRTERTIGAGDINEGDMLIGARSAIPQDIKADISRVVCAIEFRGIEGGGDCYLRAAIGYKVLRNLGFQPQVGLGGVLFRAGPDPLRDVIAFCGPGNRGQMHQGVFLGHVWLRLDGEAIDFSCGDWPRLYTPHKTDALGPVQWQCRPPSLIWAWEDAFDWKPDGTPELGKIWFCPWIGELPKFAEDRARFAASADVFAEILATNIKRMSLAERVRDLRVAPERYAAKWRHTMRPGSALHGQAQPPRLYAP
jgi:hypothetical protein